MTFSIRKIEPFDIEQLIEIEKSAAQEFLTVPDLAWIANQSVLSHADHLELIETGYSFVILNLHQQALGFLYALQRGEDFFIVEVDVRADVQKQGVGKQLIQYAIAFAQQERFKYVTLTTFIEVIWNKPFYEKLGFEIIQNQSLAQYLQDTLDCEVVYGFNRKDRCAMRKKLE